MVRILLVGVILLVLPICVKPSAASVEVHLDHNELSKLLGQPFGELELCEISWETSQSFYTNHKCEQPEHETLHSLYSITNIDDEVHELSAHRRFPGRTEAMQQYWELRERLDEDCYPQAAGDADTAASYHCRTHETFVGVASIEGHWHVFLTVRNEYLKNWPEIETDE